MDGAINQKEEMTMKRVLTSIQAMSLLLFAVAIMTACSNDDNILDEPTITEETPKSYTLTVEASKGKNTANGSNTQTRALSLDGKTLNATWAAGEEVRVYSVTGEGYEEMESVDPVGTLTAQRSGATTTLKGTFIASYTPTAGAKLRLKFCYANYDNQKGTLEYIAANCDYATAEVTISEVGTDGDVTTTAASFENQQAIVKFSLKDKDTDNAIAATGLTVKFGSVTYEVALDEPAGDIYVALPGWSNREIALSATSADGGYFCYEKSGVTFEKGKYYAIGVKMEARARSKALSAVTTSEIGWRIGSDGTAYEPTGNLPTGVTAVAMIGYISSTGHGLAIELNDAPNSVTFSDASTTATTGKPTIKGATWRLPTDDDWFNIITGCAVEGDNTAFPAEGEKALNPSNGFKQKCLDVGFPLKSTEYAKSFWTSTQPTTNSANIVFLNFYNNNAIAWFGEASNSANNYVLACLAF